LAVRVLSARRLATLLRSSEALLLRRLESLLLRRLETTLRCCRTGRLLGRCWCRRLTRAVRHDRCRVSEHRLRRLWITTGTCLRRRHGSTARSACGSVHQHCRATVRARP